MSLIHVLDDNTINKIAAGEVVEEDLSEEEQHQMNQKLALLALIDSKPEEVALLVKTWLSEEE